MTEKNLYTRAHEFFIYKDGALYWRINRGRCKIGMRAGGLSKTKLYRTIHIDDKSYYEHQIIFLMNHSYLPKIIDHIDNDRLNNKIENLRQCTINQNAYNSKKPITNTSGFKGVCWHKNRHTWQASIKVNSNPLYLGSFKTAEEAHEAYKAAALKYHGEFARF